MNEKFCLRWNDFESQLSGSFKEIRDSKDFFDVTLVSDQDQLEAHKVIISACSPFFRDLLRRNPHQHPLLYLKGVKHRELQSVLDFIYHGEVNIAQDELNSFLSVAEELQVKGLTQNQSEADRANKKSVDHSRAQKREAAPPVKSTKDSRIPPSSSASRDEDVQEVVPIKTEMSSKSDYYVDNNQQVAEYEEESYDNYQEYETDQTYDLTPELPGQELDHTKGSYHILLKLAGSSLAEPTPFLGDFQQYITKLLDGSSKGQFQCLICGKISAQKIHAQNHVESIHFPGTFMYNCKYCSKSFNGRNKLYMHVNQLHKHLK